MLDDLLTLVPEIGHNLDVIMVPKVEGAEDIHYVDRLLAQLEARAGVSGPILVHAILETARGVANVEEIAGASPRMQGLSLGPADLAANRRMKTTRVGGGHPGYLVREDPTAADGAAAYAPHDFQQDLWHYTIARMVDACAATGSTPTTGRSATSTTRGLRGPVPQRLPARLRGRVEPAPGADRHRQEGLLADPEDVALAAGHRGDGRRHRRGDDRRQDAGRRHVQAVPGSVELARSLAARDPELAEAYGRA